MNKIKKNWVIIVLLISSIAIISALIAQYLFNILPCQMCLYQRYPYYFIILFSIIYIITKKIPLALYYWINSFALAIGLFFSVWHIGIEQKILPGLSGCSSIVNNSQSLTDLKEHILNQNIITCDEITWSFMGLSAATLNSLLLIFLLLINTIFLIQHYYDKKKYPKNNFIDLN